MEVVDSYVYSIQFCSTQQQVKNERDQFDELNRRLKMDLQRVQQQAYSDKGLIKQLQDKLSQADITEREWITKYNREKDKVSDHLEKITVVENTVTTLEKQTRDYVNEIEVGKPLRNMKKNLSWCFHTQPKRHRLVPRCQFYRLVAACEQQNQACCNLSFAHLLRLVETNCSKPVDNKF